MGTGVEVGVGWGAIPIMRRGVAVAVGSNVEVGSGVAVGAGARVATGAAAAVGTAEIGVEVELGTAMGSSSPQATARRPRITRQSPREIGR